jgi:SET domain-containing protein
MLFFIQIYRFNLFKLKETLMENNQKDYKYSINIALDNAKKRINLLSNSDRKCILEEYKEWIKDGINCHSVLLLREDPII